MLRAGIATAFVAAGVAVTPAVGSGTPSAHAGDAWTWPVTGEVITAYRNGDDPYAGGQHRGIDVARQAGAPVVAATGGSVRFAGLAGSSGLTVSIRSSDGRFDTSYLHLSSADVSEGERVEAGRRVGAVGTSGRRSAAAPHLHFGVREAGSRHAYRDPLDFLPLLGPLPREAPRGAPVLVRAPARVRPAPAPVRRPSPAPRGAPARRPLRVPAARRVRVPHAGRAPRVALPRLVPAPVRAGAHGHAPQAVAPHAVPAPSVGPAPLPVARPQHPAVPSRRGAAPAAEGGPDLGWALACAGLLLAAACLGGPGKRSSGGQANRLARWSRLRPLLGRR